MAVPYKVTAIPPPPPSSVSPTTLSRQLWAVSGHAGGPATLQNLIAAKCLSVAILCAERCSARCFSPFMSFASLSHVCVRGPCIPTCARRVFLGGCVRSCVSNKGAPPQPAGLRLRGRAYKQCANACPVEQGRSQAPRAACGHRCRARRLWRDQRGSYGHPGSCRRCGSRHWLRVPGHPTDQPGGRGPSRRWLCAPQTLLPSVHGDARNLVGNLGAAIFGNIVLRVTCTAVAGGLSGMAFQRAVAAGTATREGKVMSLVGLAGLGAFGYGYLRLRAIHSCVTLTWFAACAVQSVGERFDRPDGVLQMRDLGLDASRWGGHGGINNTIGGCADFAASLRLHSRGQGDGKVWFASDTASAITTAWLTALPHIMDTYT
jgi:hypothetical protein